MSRKTLGTLILPVVLSVVTLLTNASHAQTVAGAYIHNAQYNQFSYVHRKTYSLRRPNGSMSTCYCYSVSSSGFVFGHVNVGRYSNWQSAWIARNNFARNAYTCPGACQRPVAVPNSNNTIIKSQPAVAPNWASGHAACRRKFGARSYAQRYNGGSNWNCYNPRVVRNPPAGSIRFPGGSGSCLYGLARC